MTPERRAFDRPPERRVVARLRGGKLAVRQPCVSCGTVMVLATEYIDALYTEHQRIGSDPLTSVFLCDGCISRCIPSFQSCRLH